MPGRTVKPLVAHTPGEYANVCVATRRRRSKRQFRVAKTCGLWGIWAMRGYTVYAPVCAPTAPRERMYGSGRAGEEGAEGRYGIQGGDVPRYRTAQRPRGAGGARDWTRWTAMGPGRTHDARWEARGGTWGAMRAWTGPAACGAGRGCGRYGAPPGDSSAPVRAARVAGSKDDPSIRGEV